MNNDFILTKPFETKIYAEFSSECNLAGRVIEDKGDYLEGVVTVVSELTYVEMRLSEYPAIGDQLDMIYHDIDSWRGKISEIKAKYPKE